MQEAYNHIKINQMSSQNHPLITIGITAFNAEDTISACIECALAQDWPNLEIIIADDCSTDNTFSIVEDFKNRHPSLRYYRQNSNRGVAATRNVLLKEAKGDYVVFFDDDDVSSPDRIEKQFKRLKDYSYSDLVICHASRMQIFPDGSKRTETTPGCDETVEAPHGRDMFKKIMFGKPVANGFGSLATCSLMMPRKVFETIGLYDENFRRCEDTDFTLRFALAGGHFAGITEPLVLQTMTKSSEKTLADEKKFHRDIYIKYWDDCGKQCADFGIKWLDLRYEFLHDRTLGFAKKFIQLAILHPIMLSKKIYWALPNIGFNLSLKKFHKASV